MANIGYVRVSTVEQNEDRQLEALKEYNIDKWFKEKISAKDTKRPQLKAMLEYVRAGDKVYIKDFSRLARSTKDLLSLIEYLEEKEVELISLNENLQTGTATGKMLVTLIAAINEFERNNLLERQREGIEIAKKKGVYKGKKKKDINKRKFEDLYQDMKKGYITKKEMAEKLDISRSTLYRRLREYESK